MATDYQIPNPNTSTSDANSGLIDTLGHESYENLTLRTGGNNNDSQEALAFSLADSVNRATGGNLDANNSPDFFQNLNNSTIVHFGTQQANRVGGALVDHRQLATQEVQVINQLAERMAGENKGSAAEWRERLTRQALRMVDSNANTTLFEDAEARAVLLNARGEGELTQTFIDVNGEERTLFYEEGSDFQDMNLLRREARNNEETASLYEEAGQDHRLDFAGDAASRAIAMVDTDGDGIGDRALFNGEQDLPDNTEAFERWQQKCEATPGANCSVYAFIAEEEIRAEEAMLAREEMLAADARRAAEQACGDPTVCEMLEARQHQHATMMNTLGRAQTPAEITAEILNPAYGIYTAGVFFNELYQEYGDAIAQAIKENPEEAIAIGLVATCAASTKCRHTAGEYVGRAWDDIVARSRSTASTTHVADDVAETGARRSADEVAENIGAGGRTDELVADGQYSLLDDPANTVRHPDGRLRAGADHPQRTGSFVSETGTGVQQLTTSSGITIEAREGVTTTVLGSYADDMGDIIDNQLGLPRNGNFIDGNTGGFNILNVRNSEFGTRTPEQFWEEVNRPFLDAAIERGDDIYLATTPTGSVLRNNNAYDGLSGFGREYKYLEERGYIYNSDTGRMCFGGCK